MPVPRTASAATALGHFSMSMALGAALSLFVLVTVPNTLVQAGWADPFIYTALIHDYADPVLRYGRTYYSTRIAYIFPARACVLLFGPDTGYLAFRFIVIGTGVAAAAGIARRFYGWPAALFTATWVATSPWFVRSVLWDHYDGVSALYLLIGIYFLLVPVRFVRTGHFLAGVAIALMVNTSAFTLIVGAALLPAWLLLRGRSTWREQVLRIGCFVAGFAATYLSLALLMIATVPQLGFFFESATLETAKQLLSGGGSGSGPWIEKPGDLYRQHTSLALPALLVAAVVALLAGPRAEAGTGAADRRWFALAAMVYGGLLVLLYPILSYALRGPVISAIQTMTFLFPAGLLLIIVLAGQTLAPLRRQLAWCLLGVAILLSLLNWFGARFVYAQYSELPDALFALIAALPLAALPLVRRRPAALAGICLAVAVSIPVFFYARTSEIVQQSGPPVILPGTHAQMHNPQIRNYERDVHDGALFLQRIVSETVPVARGNIGFWYDVHDASLRSVQTTHLLDFSLVGQRKGPGMPRMGDDFHADLQGRQYLVLLARTPAGIANGLAALASERYRFDTVRQETFAGREWGFALAILRLDRRDFPPDALLARPDAGRIAALNGTVAVADEAVAVATTGTPWDYAARLPLDADIDGPVVIRVRMIVEQGELGVGAVRRDNHSSFIRERLVTPSAAPVFVDVAVPDAGNAGWLMFRNGSQSTTSRARILSIEVYRDGID